MRIRTQAVCSSVAFLAILASLGCGSSSVTPPPVAAVAASAHPLVAQYSISHFDSGLSAWVEFGTDTTYGRQTSVTTSSTGALAVQKLNILVAGMKAKTTYHMRAHAGWPGGSWVDQDRTFTTGAIPSTYVVPQFSVTKTPAAGSPASGVELLSLINNAVPNTLNAVATDLQGDVIWYCPGAAIPVKPMPNGHYFLLQGSAIAEVDLACNTIRSVTATQLDQSLQAHGYSYPPIDNLHHDMLVLPNGHWIALANVTESLTGLQCSQGTTSVQGDILMDIDPGGNVVWAWSAFDPGQEDPCRALFGLPDWTHSNALVYTADGNLLLSQRNQSWILKIDYENGTGTQGILWRLGQDGDFKISGGDPSQWFYAQHYPVILNVNGSQTTMAIYDDGDLRLAPDLTPCSPPIPPVTNCYTRATIFQIDESTNDASLQWQYSPGFFSFWGGSIDVLSNNDVEFDSSARFGFATSSQIMEVTQTDTPQVVWQMTVTGANAYRGFRVPSLYPGVTWQQ
jgi:arylsulfate sulfotransferase